MKNITLRIEQDIDPINPRVDWDPLCKMVCFHGRYTLGDDLKGDFVHTPSDFDGWDEMERCLEKEYGAVVVLPLFLYDHGGITIRVDPYPCQWDSGQVGFIYATREDVLDEYGKKRLSKKIIENVESLMRAEVEVYDQYITGEVYGAVIEDENGEHLDSCWGLFGHAFAEEEGEAMLSTFLSD